MNLFQNNNNISISKMAKKLQKMVKKLQKMAKKCKKW
tara:strand:+ start:2619 stop:2729 length:111 start_codon:yes stop_codon:yes gene_type:complete